jgi:hypothetical protein
MPDLLLERWRIRDAEPGAGILAVEKIVAAAVCR